MLKRFKKVGEEMKKIHASIPYTTTLWINNRLYEMKGIVTHEGPSLRNGHYISIIKRDNNVWYCCNDIWIQKITEEQVKEHS